MAVLCSEVQAVGSSAPLAQVDASSWSHELTHDKQVTVTHSHVECSFPCNASTVCDMSGRVTWCSASTVCDMSGRVTWCNASTVCDTSGRVTLCSAITMCDMSGRVTWCSASTVCDMSGRVTWCNASTVCDTSGRVTLCSAITMCDMSGRQRNMVRMLCKYISSIQFIVKLDYNCLYCSMYICARKFTIS